MKLTRSEVQRPGLRDMDGEEELVIYALYNRWRVNNYTVHDGDHCYSVSVVSSAGRARSTC